MMVRSIARRATAASLAQKAMVSVLVPARSAWRVLTRSILRTRKTLKCTELATPPFQVQVQALGVARKQNSVVNVVSNLPANSAKVVARECKFVSHANPQQHSHSAAFRNSRYFYLSVDAFEQFLLYLCFHISIVCFSF